jgi:outer membrane protein assembly factor BamB
LLVGIRDCFAINGSLWLGGFKPWRGARKKHRGPAWGPYYATQRDLSTGKLLQHIEPQGPGHHHRCWRNKATTRYILGGRRGVEFIDLKSGDYLWHNWVRGVCRYGVMPSNGLLYAPPHACGCYVAAKLTGFYALAHGTDEAVSARDPDDGRLERGPAYADAGDQSADAPSAADWPTYRHDPKRSGATGSSVPAKLQRAWKAKLGGTLSSVTVAGGKVFVASRDEHTLYALDAASGETAWRFAAGGRIDSPPTIHAGRAIFGCRDGSVYSVRAADGALAWRLHAAGTDRRMVAWGQLESASPIPGSILMRDGTAYVLAGRSSYLDGGLDLYRVRAETGEVLSRSRVYSPDPETGRQPPQYGPCYMPGALGDILSILGHFVYLRYLLFDPRCDRL